MCVQGFGAHLASLMIAVCTNLVPDAASRPGSVSSHLSKVTRVSVPLVSSGSTQF